MTATAGGTFTADVGQPVTVSYLDTTSPNNGYFSPFSPPPSPRNRQSSGHRSSRRLVGAVQLPPFRSSSSPRPEPLTAATEIAQLSGVGLGGCDDRLDVAGDGFTVGTDYDLALTGCQSSLHADAGEIYPNNVTLTQHRDR